MAVKCCKVLIHNSAVSLQFSTTGHESVVVVLVIAFSDGAPSLAVKSCN